MGVELDGVVEFEELAISGRDAPSAISLLEFVDIAARLPTRARRWARRPKTDVLG
jgi:hypothetical protein